VSEREIRVRAVVVARREAGTTFVLEHGSINAVDSDLVNTGKSRACLTLNPIPKKTARPPKKTDPPAENRTNRTSKTAILIF